MARDEKQFTLIYSSNTRVGTHVLSYLQGIEDKILAIDIAKTKVSDTQWVELADKMNCKVADLIDKRVAKVDNTAAYGTNDWLKVLQNNDEVLSWPIAVNGDRTAQIENAPDVMEFFGVESAGLKKTPHTDDPTIKPTTNGENFK
ncbi:arsenate reductase family protein [Constantimarinum furrinae]|nr:hypothetical protein [Constantimarinum furrinae]